MKKFIQQLIDLNFHLLISGNANDSNRYHFKQFMIIVTDNGWTVFYDRLGSNIPIFKNTYLISDNSFCLEPILDTITGLSPITSECKTSY